MEEKKYNFDERPPITKDEIEHYLRSYFTPLSEEESSSSNIVSFDNSKWRQTHGFRRAFTIHSVFINDTNEYAFNIDEWKDDTRPTMGIYESFDEMITEVAIMYYKCWTLGIRGDMIKKEMIFKPRKKLCSIIPENEEIFLS